MRFPLTGDLFTAGELMSLFLTQKIDSIFRPNFIFSNNKIDAGPDAERRLDRIMYRHVHVSFIFKVL